MNLRSISRTFGSSSDHCWSPCRLYVERRRTLHQLHRLRLYRLPLHLNVGASFRTTRPTWKKGLFPMISFERFKRSIGPSMTISGGSSSVKQRECGSGGRECFRLTLLRRYLESANSSSSLCNDLLGQLLPLTNLPRVQTDLNTFFIPSLATSPISNASIPPAKKKKAKSKVPKGAESLPNWMDAYESDSSTDSNDMTGAKRRERTSALSIHASIHSIPSHQKAYSTLWETALSKLEMDEMWTAASAGGLAWRKTGF